MKYDIGTKVTSNGIEGVVEAHVMGLYALRYKSGEPSEILRREDSLTPVDHIFSVLHKEWVVSPQGTGSYQSYLFKHVDRIKEALNK